jgi:hypothetical protein
MKYLVPAISAAVAGATAMYYLDPDRGKRRRALARDKIVSASIHTSELTRAQSRRVSNGVRVLGARIVSHLPSRGEAARPDVVHQRVRSHLGRVVSHPKAVDVEVLDDRCVRLGGHILADELDALIDTLEKVPGVARVDNQLMVHESAGNIPELQGATRRSAQGNARGRLWRVLAVLAPVAVVAATMRPRARRSMWRPHQRRSLLQRLASDREALPSLLRRPLRGRGYFSALRVS